MKWLFLKYQPSDDDLSSSNSFRVKRKWYKAKQVKKLALYSQLLTVQVLNLCLSYFIAAISEMINVPSVQGIGKQKLYFSPLLAKIIQSYFQLR